MEDGEDKIDEDLSTIETAAGKVAQHTKAEKQKLYTLHERMPHYVRELLQDAQT